MMKCYSVLVFICLISLFCSNSVLVNNKSNNIIKGKRPGKNVMQNVMNNLNSLRKIYDQRLHDKPELKGKIVVDFKVLGTGKVIDGIIVESTIHDSIFEQRAIMEINSWKFDEYEDPSDTTEKIYPFIFSP